VSRIQFQRSNIWFDIGFTNKGANEVSTDEVSTDEVSNEEDDNEGATKDDTTTKEGGVIVVMVPVGETMCIFGGVYQFVNGTAFLVACGKDNKVASA
jgi:hypothetical protein